MAHNARIHTAVTGWPDGYVVIQADLLAIDTLLFQSINGDLGGTWAPSARITIGGAGTTIDTTSGNFLVTGSGVINLFSSAVTVSSTITNFYGGAFIVDPSAGISIATPTVDFGASTLVTFNNGLDVATGNIDVDAGSVGITAGDLILAAGNITLTAGNVTLTAGNIDVGGNAAVAGTLGVLGLSSLNTVTAVSYSTSGSGVVATGSTLVTAGGTTATFNGPAVFANTATIQSALALSGVGRLRLRLPVTLPNADATITIATSETYYVPAITADRTYILTTTGASDGDAVVVNAQSNTSHVAQIVDDGAVNIIGLQNVSGDSFIVEFMMVAGAWKLRQRSTA